MPERDESIRCRCGRWRSVQVYPANQDRPFSAVVLRCVACGRTGHVEYIPAHPPVIPPTSEDGL